VRRSSDFPELGQLFLDHGVDAGGIAEDRAQLRDALLQVVELRLDLVPREFRQPGEAEVEDRLRLDLGEVEGAHEPLARRIGIGGGANQRNNLVQPVERLEVALEDVRSLLGLAKLVLRPARDDIALVVEVVPDQLEQRQRPGSAVDERDGVVTERRLQRGQLEELVQRNLRDGLALELDVDAHALLVGVVLQRVVGHRHLGQRACLHQVGDLVDDAAFARLANAVGQLGDDDRALAAAQLLDVRTTTHRDASATGAIRVADAAATDDRATSREVGALHMLREALDIDGRVVDHRADRIDYLAEVVWWDVGRHADGDAGGAVDEQVGEARR
jgi:hypothetical protein